MEDRLERVILLIDRYLSGIFGSIRVYRDNNEFLIPWGSTVINVEVSSDEEEIVVSVYSPVALRVKSHKDLMRFLLMENASFKMCGFYIELEGDLMDIILGTRIGFDLLSKELLGYVAINVGNLANEYSKEIIAVFGGMSFKEYVERERLEEKSSEKILHDNFELEGVGMTLELYGLPEGGYVILGKVLETGHVFLRAERKKELNEMFQLMEKIKKFLLEGNLTSIKKHLKHFEIEESFLYRILVEKGDDRTKRLKEAEKEIQLLTEMLIKGEVSQEEYRRRISEIERLLGLK